MRLPRESPWSSQGAKGYQMQQVIETHLPHLSRPQLTGLVLWGVRCYSGRRCRPERRGLGTLSLGQMEQPAPVSPGVVVRRQRPGPSLPDRTGRKSLLPPLLRWVLAWWRSGRLALAVDPTLKGDQTPAIVLSVVYRSCAIPVAWRIHRATQRGSWMDPTVELLRELRPSGSQGNDRHRALRPGHSQSQAVATDTRSRLASLHEVSEERQLLRPRRPPVARTALRFPSRYGLDWPRHRLQHPHRKTPLHPAGGLVRRAGRTLDHPH